LRPWGVGGPVHEPMPRGASCNRKVAFLCLPCVEHVGMPTCQHASVTVKGDSNGRLEPTNTHLDVRAGGMTHDVDADGRPAELRPV
jgi:hypothetical protein